MKIYIPTRARPNTQITLGQLPAVLRAHTTLVIDSADRNSFAQYQMHDILVCPPSVNSIGKVRQFICDNHNVRKYGELLLMLDDDLRFYKRRIDEPDKFVNALPQDIVNMVHSLEAQMRTFGYVHGGVLAREGGNRVIEPVRECTRLLRALAYNVLIIRKHKVRFDRLIVMEDFDVALQLLRLGYPSVAVCGWVHNQAGSGAVGGCSTYRTMEKQAEGARGLAKLHAPYVKLVQKTTKTAWGGATRTDVVVQWKHAYEESQHD